eukprot:gb/GECG01007666.1/.p1 GENE.gb/GECG01007666.1/~~gb/GECG01007666.1/.p1  ORF type:complete len:1185 (+),score=147.29 gb/GECG01007666.1/:1-3555(+)
MSSHAPQDSLTGAIVSGEIARVWRDEPEEDPEYERQRHRSRNYSKAVSTIQEHLEEAIELEKELTSRDIQSSAKQLMQEYPTDPQQGLTSEEAAERLARDGPNELEKDENVPIWKIFIMQFMNFLILLLLGACIASFALEEIAEGVAIIVIVVLNACIATWTEKSASNALAALASLSQPSAEVIRDGQTKHIRTSEVVKGDIVNLYTGDVVPADCLLLSSADLKVNEMPLTGEAADVSKNYQHSSGSDTLTPPNRVFSSTTVTAGSAKGLVIAIGMDTRVGEIAKRLAGGSEEEGGPKVNCLGVKERKQTPLQVKLHKMGLVIAMLAGIACVSVLAIGIGRDFQDPEHPDQSVAVAMVLIAVALGVSAIPEGLPLCVTIALAWGTRDMAQRWNALVRNLPAVETLGSANVICSDKTGTLTQGKMTALKMYALDGEDNDSEREVSITTGGLMPVGEFLEDGKNIMDGKGDPQFKGILESAILNSTAHVKLQEDPRNSESTRSLTEEEMSMPREDFRQFAIKSLWTGEGNNSEIPLVVAAMKSGLFKPKEDNRYPSVGWRACQKEGPEIPFSSSRKMMASVVHTDDEFLGSIPLPEGTKYCVLVKGAPNYVVKKCTNALYRDCKFGKMDESRQNQVVEAVDELSSQALRVLAFAIKPLKELPYDPEDSNIDAEDKFDMLVKDLVFTGLMASIDPPREGVSDSINVARHAGVRTVMITGDYLKTAAAIGRNIELITVNDDPEQVAVDCQSLRPHADGSYLPDKDIDEITSRVVVFARAQPEDKLQIVNSLQRQGHVVGMTGDGVNDAPALNEADIGVAMGIAGTEVAKGASDMILLDDNFNTIVSAVRKGRQIYTNIQKFVTYLLGTNLSQVFIILTAVIVGTPVPLGPLGVLFLNLAIDGVPAMSLSVQPEDEGIMEMKPRPKTQPLILNRMWIKVLGHAISTALFTLISYSVGMEWFIGETFAEDMFVDGDTPINRCEVRREDGSTDIVIGDDCVGRGLSFARTMAFITIVYGEVLRGLTVRTHLGIWHKPLSNKMLLYAILISAGLSTCLILIPGFRDLFGFEGTDLPWWAWLFSLALMFITVINDELIKFWLRSSDERQAEREEMRDFFNEVLQEMRQMRHHMYDMESKLQLRNDKPHRRAEIQESVELALRKQGITKENVLRDGSSGAAADTEDVNVTASRT